MVVHRFVLIAALAALLFANGCFDPTERYQRNPHAWITFQADTLAIQAKYEPHNEEPEMGLPPVQAEVMREHGHWYIHLAAREVVNGHLHTLNLHWMQKHLMPGHVPIEMQAYPIEGKGSTHSRPCAIYTVSDSLDAEHTHKYWTQPPAGQLRIMSLPHEHSIVGIFDIRLRDADGQLFHIKNGHFELQPEFFRHHLEDPSE